MAEKGGVLRPPVEAADDEAVRRRHVAAFEALLPPHGQRIAWSSERLARWRLRRLRELISVALERSPWHRERLAGIDVGGLSEADIERLPVMTRADLMDNFDEIVTDRRLTRQRCQAHLDDPSRPTYLLGAYHVVASGGSSGQPGLFVYGWDAWAICYASIVRFQDRDWRSDPALADIPRLSAVVAASNSKHISAALSQTFSTPRNPRHLVPVTWPLEEIVKGLNDLDPTVLMGYSSFLPRLAVEARAGRLRISPRRIVAISEPLLPETKASLHQTWGVPVANGYGMSEGVFTGSCRHAIHLPDDLCIFEPVDVAGRPVTPGSASHRLYITNLYNHALPLIRLEVTDEVTLLDQTCPCGSAMRCIGDPHGRLDDVFVYAGGVSVHPHVFRSTLGANPEIIEYQVRQTARGADISIVVQTEIDRHAVGQKIAKDLAAIGIEEPWVAVSTVESIRRQTSGKLKRFVPLSD